MTHTRLAWILLVGVAGCATRAELLQQDRELRGLVKEQRKQIQQVQREIERLRADVEEGGTRRGGGTGAGEDRLAALEQRVSELEHGGEGTAAPEVGMPGTPPTTLPPVASVPPAAPKPPAGEDDGWRAEVTREQKTAGAVAVPERAEYLGILDGLARQDCARTVPQLNGFASNHKDSPLADNALYWAARCYAVKGDQNQAVSKFYDVVTKYPKGDKAPAALLAQGDLFVGMGDTPDARLALSKLIREYPNSEEAAKARQRLSDLEN
ncbi:MAG TPA: tetratricopeptide repeat protein [Candidatus Binatia bacterium]|nr:tetratricopeptide repeat protein [Candidatus Binatia bacterium]